MRDEENFRRQILTFGKKWLLQGKRKKTVKNTEQKSVVTKKFFCQNKLKLTPE